MLEEVVSDDSANWLPAAAATYLGDSPYMTSARVKKYPFVFNVNLEISLNLGTNGIRILQKEGEGVKESKNMWTSSMEGPLPCRRPRQIRFLLRHARNERNSEELSSLSLLS